jgi:hypothetical protein
MDVCSTREKKALYCHLGPKAMRIRRPHRRTRIPSDCKLFLHHFAYNLGDGQKTSRLCRRMCLEGTPIVYIFATVTERSTTLWADFPVAAGRRWAGRHRFCTAMLDAHATHFTRSSLPARGFFRPRGAAPLAALHLPKRMGDSDARRRPGRAGKRFDHGSHG